MKRKERQNGCVGFTDEEPVSQQNKTQFVENCTLPHANVFQHQNQHGKCIPTSATYIDRLVLLHTFQGTRDHIIRRASVLARARTNLASATAHDPNACNLS